MVPTALCSAQAVYPGALPGVNADPANRASIEWITESGKQANPA